MLPAEAGSESKRGPGKEFQKQAMKRSIWVPTALLTALTMGMAAQTPSAPAPARPASAARSSSAVPSSVGPAKIAVIAFQVAITNTNEFQRAFLDVQKQYSPKRDALHKMSDDINALTKELQATDSKLTDAEKAQKAKTLDTEQKQFDREQQADQSDFTQAVQELYQETASKVFDVLSSYAQQHGYTLVLDVASQQTPVMFALPTMDITKEITAEYNAKSGVPPPPAQPAGTPAPSVPSAQKPAPKPPSQ